eukprot:285353-Prorocentrum_lima.AAC.1
MLGGAPPTHCSLHGLFKKLDVFWMHSNWYIAFRLQAYTAIARAKLLSGVEPVQLTEQKR